MRESCVSKHDIPYSKPSKASMERGAEYVRLVKQAAQAKSLMEGAEAGSAQYELAQGMLKIVNRGVVRHRFVSRWFDDAVCMRMEADVRKR